MRCVNPVREQRERAGLTQQALAERAGLSLRTVAYVEGGRGMKVETLTAISRALGCSLDDLLERETA